MEFITGGTSLSLGCLFSQGSSVGKGEWSKIPFTCLNEVSGASGKKQVAGNRQGEEQDFNKLIHINRCDGQKLALRTPQTLSLFYRNACIFLCLSFLCIHRGEENSHQKETGHTQGGSMGWRGDTGNRERGGDGAHTGRQHGEATENERQEEMLGSDIKRENPGMTHQREGSGRCPSERERLGTQREGSWGHVIRYRDPGTLFWAFTH